MIDTDDEPRTGGSATSLMIKVVVGFWALHLTYRFIVAAIGHSFDRSFDPALDIALAIGFVLSFGFCALLAQLVRRGLAYALIATALLSFPLAMLHSSIELALYFGFSPALEKTTRVETLPDGTTVSATPDGQVVYTRPSDKRVTRVKVPSRREMLLDSALETVTANTTGWYFFFFGLGALFVGMRSADDLRQRERDVERYQRLAQHFQLEALRYQINPHFLFNTLNSLSALIMTDRAEAAEEMVLNLSNFFRQTLSVDPAEDIPLRDELLLQRLYLDIESVRFPERLLVAIDAPEDTLDVPVPALLLQPLVENAIKHGVARSGASVMVRIAACRPSPATLELVIENETGGRQPMDGTSTGTGLRNVRQRLNARYGNAASCAAFLEGTNLFRVTLSLPIEAEGR